MKTLHLKRLLGLLALAAVLSTPDAVLAQFPGFGGAPGGGRTGGAPGGRTRTGGGGNSAALQAQSKVLAVADERSNSLIIIAPEDQIPMIEELIGKIDDDVDDVTEVRIIKLNNADPIEVAEQINQLFGSGQTQNSQQQGFGAAAIFASRFGGGTPQTGRSGNDRGKRSTQEVMAVADSRTGSLIISAPRQMIVTVEQLVQQLDASSAKKQNVFVYSLEHADVNAATEILRALFEGANTRNTQSQNQNQDTALRSRAGTFGTAGNSNGNIAGGGGGGGGGGIGGRR